MEKKKKVKIWVNVSETINIGDYNSVKIEAGFSKPYEDENPVKLIDESIDELSEMLKKKIKKIRKKKGL